MTSPVRLSTVRADKLPAPPEGTFSVTPPGHARPVEGYIRWSAHRPRDKYVVDLKGWDRMKCTGCRLIEAQGIGGKWSRQAGGYVVSRSALARWWAMLHAGWSADLFGKLEAPCAS